MRVLDSGPRRLARVPQTRRRRRVGDDLSPPPSPDQDVEDMWRLIRGSYFYLK